MTNSKKLLGIGFIVLFATFLIGYCTRYITSLIPYEYLDSYYKILSAWYLFSDTLQILAVIFISFICKGQSSVIAKIGGCVFSAVLLWYAICELAYISSIQLQPSITVREIIHITLYIPGIMMLAWGTKLWMPSKIILSVSMFLGIITSMIWMKLDQLLSDYETWHSQASMTLQTIDGICHAIIVLCLAACLVLTIIWACKRPKPQSIPTQIHSLR